MLTKRQEEVMQAYTDSNNNAVVAAKKLGMSKQGVQAAVNAVKLKLAKNGISDSMNLSDHVLPGHYVKGVSTLIDSDGKEKIRWIKSDTDKEHQEQIMKTMVEAMCEDIKPAKAVKPAPKKTDKDLLNMFIITDYHLGMYAWCEETNGMDWDIKKAEKFLYDWFVAAIEQAPDAHTAVFAQLGDFHHWDGMIPETNASKNSLDADTRIQKLIRVAIRVTRRVIALLLSKHKHVHVLMCEGNHDEASSARDREMWPVLYENEPRITVDKSVFPFYSYEWGATSLFWHHGHKKNHKQVPQVFMTHFRELYGRTKYSYGHTGHMHHELVDGSGPIHMTQHNTLAPNDSYSGKLGFGSDQRSQVVTYHKEFGRVGIVEVGPQIFMDKLK